MATRLESCRLLLKAVFPAIVFMVGGALWAQTPTLTITLTGQSMIRSDIRSTAPSNIPAIKALLKGDVIFTNFEGTVAEPGQPNDSAPIRGGGFVAPPGALDSLKELGFNLIDYPTTMRTIWRSRAFRTRSRRQPAWAWFMPGPGRPLRKPQRLHTCTRPKARLRWWRWPQA
jgi:Bacterial capsule synthesis protein PGA_cap